jgi:hypothetical protein
LQRPLPDGRFGSSPAASRKIQSVRRGDLLASIRDRLTEP